MANGASVPVVVVDPGHGGQAKVAGSSSNNATGPNGLLEKDVALDLAQRTAMALGGRARSVLTRTGDVNLSLSDRAGAARSGHANVFCSIHLNGTNDTSVDGTAVWVARGASQASLELAQSVLDRIVAVTGGPSRGVQRADLGVLVPARHDPETAACLVELAYLTNPDEAHRLTDSAYRDRLAGALASAIGSHLDTRAVQAPSSSSQGKVFGQSQGKVFGQSQGKVFGQSQGKVFAATYSRTAAIVSPDIDYRSTSLADSIRIWADWLSRYSEWRKGVPNESLFYFPHAAICQLKLYDASNNLAYGTGFYIADEVLLTCGHNFVDAADHWTTVRVEVQPGHSPNASTLPSKTFDVVAADIVHPRWRDAADSTHDLAVLRVPGLPQTVGTFTPANRSLAASVGIVVCGYGKVDGEDYENQGQRMDGAHIAEADTEMVYYPIQTIGGHSGSPVFDDAEVIGVHTGPRMNPDGSVSTHQNRAVLLNPEKTDWINSRAGTTFGQSLAAFSVSRRNGHAPKPTAYALTDQNSTQTEQSEAVKRNVARSLGQAETNLRFDLISHDSQRTNFGIASWTGPEIAELLDVYLQVAQEQGITAQLFNYFGGQAQFQAVHDQFAQNGSAFQATATVEGQLHALGADAALQDAQIRKEAADVAAALDDIGSNGNPWYPWIDGGMGAISEIAAHVLVHARHQSGSVGLRRRLRAAIDFYGGDAALGQAMVNGTVTELDFLSRVGEEVALHVQPQYQNGVRNRYRTLLNNFGNSQLSFYFHPAN